MEEMEEVWVFERPGIILITTESDYTDKNATDLLQVAYQLVENLLQQTCQFHQVATSLLKSGLLQLVICRLVTTC